MRKPFEKNVRFLLTVSTILVHSFSFRFRNGAQSKRVYHSFPFETILRRLVPLPVNQIHRKSRDSRYVFFFYQPRRIRKRYIRGVFIVLLLACSFLLPILPRFCSSIISVYYRFWQFYARHTPNADNTKYIAAPIHGSRGRHNARRILSCHFSNGNLSCYL